MLHNSNKWSEAKNEYKRNHSSPDVDFKSFQPDEASQVESPAGMGMRYAKKNTHRSSQVRLATD